MRQTLFYIPETIGGIPLFGFGLLLALWGLASGVWLVRSVALRGWDATVRSHVAALLITGAVIAWVLPAIAVPGLGLPIRGYGVFMLAAVAASIALAIRLSRGAGLDDDVMSSLAVWLCAGGFVGARLFYVVEYWPLLRSESDSVWELARNILNFTQGGLVVFGALVGAATAFGLFVWRHALPALALADLVAPSLALGQGIGRIGCFMSGCCYGGATDLPWGVVFPWGAPAHVQQVKAGEVPLYGIRFRDGSPGAKETGPALVAEVVANSAADLAGIRTGDVIVAVHDQPVATAREAELLLLRASPSSNGRARVLLRGEARPREWAIPSGNGYMRPVHPTQIYSAIDALLLALFLWAYYPFRRRDGEVIAWLLTIHPLTRYLLESIRVDEPQVFGTGLSISQVLSVALFCGAMGLWWRVMSTRREPASSWPQSRYS